MNDNFIAFEIDEDGCGKLKSELPLDLNAAEIKYIKSLVPRAQSGMLELLDPNTGDVVFTCTPTLVLWQRGESSTGRINTIRMSRTS